MPSLIPRAAVVQINTPLFCPGFIEVGSNNKIIEAVVVDITAS